VWEAGTNLTLILWQTDSSVENKLFTSIAQLRSTCCNSTLQCRLKWDPSRRESCPEQRMLDGSVDKKVKLFTSIAQLRSTCCNSILYRHASLYATDGQLLPYSSFTATFPAARITEQKYSQLGRVPALTLCPTNNLTTVPSWVRPLKTWKSSRTKNVGWFSCQKGLQISKTIPSCAVIKPQDSPICASKSTTSRQTLELPSER